ncbi:hypothetical protein M0811_05318 [Anaeramoeba ignava]|uniref:Uncharacterized protein n=1 Tax=Anaeramoeba ignava TaxID=1746090 RepID=A0A9Q0LUB9_ANAIG|nr:hypothetical protein M0811_05318 [Anaeramoeba ignava]
MIDVIIVHGFGCNSTNLWYSWLKKELDSTEEFQAITPDFPNPKDPELKEWIKTLEKAIESTNEKNQLILIGHSLGGFTILRYLEKLEDEEIRKRILSIYLVASPSLTRERATSFYSPKINLQKIDQLILDLKIPFFAIWSEDDKIVPKEHIDYLSGNDGLSSLQCKIINNYGHFLEKTNQYLLDLIKENHLKN